MQDVTRAVKRCPACGITKPADGFHRNKSRGDGLQTHCKPCMSARVSAYYRDHPERRRAVYEKRRGAARENVLQRTYGIGQADYDELLDAQGGACAICRSSSPGVDRVRYFAVDHDHDTGAVRGLLCVNCNTGIGQLGDDPDRLEAAARYLREAN